MWSLIDDDTIADSLNDYGGRCFLQVEFPEARIYEETLNILLYEHRNGPDQELMQATSSRGAVGSALPCTSDEEEGERSGLARLRSNKQNTN